MCDIDDQNIGFVSTLRCVTNLKIAIEYLVGIR